jgi:uncharacterized protein (TIGR02186 family)
MTGLLALLLLLPGAVGSPASASEAVAAESLPVSVEPARGEIGLFYRGLQVTVSMPAEPGSEVAVLLSGPRSRLSLRSKARRFGLFWGPAGEVVFEAVPSLYLLSSSRELRDLTDAATLQRLGLGYDALRDAEPAGAEEWFSELLTLKESEGLFSVSVSAPERDEARQDRLSLPLWIPARARAERYAVEGFCFREGRLLSRGEAWLEIGTGGVVALMADMAHRHGLGYGIFAVVAALFSGLLVGLLFGSTKKR